MRAHRFGVLGAITGAVVSWAAFAVPAQGALPRFAAPLSVSGTQIVDSSGLPVVLRGLHRNGSQRVTPSFPSSHEVAEMAGRTAWDANVVRVPLGAAQWLGACSYTASSATAYRAAVDAEVSQITALGSVALLDLHAVSPKCMKADRYPMPDPDALRFWQSAAPHYKGNALVAFELYNEPHWVSDDVWLHGTSGETQTNCSPDSSTTSGAAAASLLPTAGSVVPMSASTSYALCSTSPFTTRWRAVGMQALYDAVSKAAPHHLVVVDGNAWGADVPTQLVAPGPDGVVYAFHPYTCPGQQTCTADPTQADRPMIAAWKQFSVAYNVPVLATEVGWPVKKPNGAANVSGAGFYSDTITRLGGIGIIGYAFDGTKSGTFDLVLDVTGTNAYKPNVTARPLFDLLRTNP